MASRVHSPGRLSVSVSTLLFVSVACGALAACGGPTVKRDAPEYKRPVGSVEIRGNTVLDDDEIIGGLVNAGPEGILFFRKKPLFEPAEVALDAQRIEGVYRQRGYFDAKVVNISIDREGLVDLVFEVEEGEPVTLEEVAIDWKRTPNGEYEESTAELREEIKTETMLFECCQTHTRKGDVLDHIDYLDAKERLRRFFVERGYAHVKIDGRVAVDLKEHSAEVSFAVDPGPIVRMGETRITGLSTMPITVVQNRISWKEGEIFDPDEIATTRGRLLRLGRFSEVTLKTEEDRPRDVADIHIDLGEERLREIRLGGGAAVDPVQFELRLRAEYSKSNVFFDPLLRLRAQARPAYRWLRGSTDSLGLGGEALVSLERIDAFAPLVTAEVDLVYGLERFESYSVQGPRSRLSLRRPFFGERLYVGVAWNVALATFPDLSPVISEDAELAARLGVDEAYRVGYYEQSLALDLRDDVLDPHSGVYLGARLEEGTRYAVGRYEYVKGEIDTRGYYPVTDRVVLAGRVRHTQLLAGDSLPLTRRLFGGGASSQRGFAQRRLSPVRAPADPDSEVDDALVGGNVRFESSAEVRWDVRPMFGNWLGVVGFVDGAEVTEEVDEFDIGRLHYAAGFGLRLGTLIGPIRADFGYRLNRVGAGEPAPNSRFAVHVSIGEAF